MPTVVLANPSVICSAAVLGEICGITDRRVRQLVHDGILKTARTKLNGMHFRLGESVQRFVKYECDLVSEQFEASNGEYEKARTRKAQAAATMMELELKARQGLYLRKDDIEFHLSLLLRNCRDRILAIPSRLGHVLRGKITFREVHDPIEAEVRLALNEIADKKCFDWPRMRKETSAYLTEQGFPPDEIESILDEREQRRAARLNSEKPHTEA